MLKQYWSFKRGKQTIAYPKSHPQDSPLPTIYGYMIQLKRFYFIWMNLLLLSRKEEGAYQSSLEPGGVAYKAPAFLQLSRIFWLYGAFALPPFTRCMCKMISGNFFDLVTLCIAFTTEFTCKERDPISAVSSVCLPAFWVKKDRIIALHCLAGQKHYTWEKLKDLLL